LLFILVVGLVMWLRPGAWWELTESWKADTVTEPSDMYLRLTRIGGLFFTFVAVAGAIALLLLK
jgi:hypothetical protein